jgi:hypothetical protein
VQQRVRLVERRIVPNQPTPAPVDDKPTSDLGCEQITFDMTNGTPTTPEMIGQDSASTALFPIVAYLAR